MPHGEKTDLVQHSGDTGQFIPECASGKWNKTGQCMYIEGRAVTVCCYSDTLLLIVAAVSAQACRNVPIAPECTGQLVRPRVNESVDIITKKIRMVDLPLGTTEDGVCGAIDIEKALTVGVKAFEPGLLAKANRGLLYVDETASGWNIVEREGISISHPARFILVGSGIPEEGELRPQLLHRFGMHAESGTRVEKAIIRWDAVAAAFCCQAVLNHILYTLPAPRHMAQKPMCGVHTTCANDPCARRLCRKPQVVAQQSHQTLEPAPGTASPGPKPWLPSFDLSGRCQGALSPR
eukprot:jgi/Botrbrau1/7759/Bobra.0159s0188.1